MVEVADIGVRGNYLSSTLSRYEDEELTLIEMQTNVEKINDSEEITTMRSHEYSWQLTLQFGSSFRSIINGLLEVVSDREFNIETRWFYATHKNKKHTC